MEVELGGVDGLAVEVEVVQDEGLGLAGLGRQSQGDGVAVAADEAFYGGLVAGRGAGTAGGFGDVGRGLLGGGGGLRSLGEGKGSSEQEGEGRDGAEWGHAFLVSRLDDNLLYRSFADGEGAGRLGLGTRFGHDVEMGPICKGGERKNCDMMA